MKAKGAIIREFPGKYEIADLVIDEPRHGEVTVRMVACGLCHSDDHPATGDLPMFNYPVCGGHEGAGIIEAVGPMTSRFEIGDHVVFSFLPGCGRCRWCASGMQNLCDLGAGLMIGARFDDPTSFRVHLEDGTNVAQLCGVGALTELATVSADSVVKVDKDLPLERLCLLGCGVGTGWGSAVNSAEAGPGDTIVIMGIGGVGINAVQGAAHAGASNVIAVDPIEMKRDMAMKFGATHAVADISDAGELARSMTNGQGADAAIVTVGVVNGDLVGQAFGTVRKGGTCVVTALGNFNDVGVSIPLGELTLFQKRLQGALFGACNPSADIPRQVQMYRDGRLNLDDIVTREYNLAQVAQGFEDMHGGKNLRGVVRFDD